MLVAVDSWPLKDGNNVDIKRRPANTHGTFTGAGAGGETARAVSRAEEFIAWNVFATLLEVDVSSIGIDTSFFELGGSSLRAVALLRLLSNAVVCKLDMADILHEPTPSGVVASAHLTMASFLRVCDLVEFTTVFQCEGFDVQDLRALDPGDLIDLLHNEPLLLSAIAIATVLEHLHNFTISSNF
jgi:acyl carrier protein